MIKKYLMFALILLIIPLTLASSNIQFHPTDQLNKTTGIYWGNQSVTYILDGITSMFSNYLSINGSNSNQDIGIGIYNFSANYINATGFQVKGVQLNSTHIIDHDGHSIKDTFNHIINRGVSETITVSLTGGLDVEWTAGEVYDFSIEDFVKTDAGSGTLVSDQVNYLKYTGTSTLELQTSSSSGDEILIAKFSNWDGNIAGYREMSLIDASMSDTRRGLRIAFPNRIINGMSVSEDTDATNSLDVSMDAGKLIKDGIEERNPTAINSRTLPLIRLFHSGGDWTNDSNAEIDTIQYDDGNDLDNIPANKWTKAYFIYAHHQLGWVYPTTYYNTKAQAEAGALSPIPEGLAQTPKLTTVVYQQGDTDFSNAVWQDVRPGISEESFNIVTDHGDLAGLSDDDHPQYLLADGSRNMAGNLNLGVYNLTNATNLYVDHIAENEEGHGVVFDNDVDMGVSSNILIGDGTAKIGAFGDNDNRIAIDGGDTVIEWINSPEWFFVSGDAEIEFYTDNARTLKIRNEQGGSNAKANLDVQNNLIVGDDANIGGGVFASNINSTYGNFTTLTVTGTAYIGELTWNGNLDLGGNNITNVDWGNFTNLNVTRNIRAGATTILSTTEPQFKIGYDATKFISFSVSDAGITTIDTGSPSIIINKPVAVIGDIAGTGDITRTGGMVLTTDADHITHSLNAHQYIITDARDTTASPIWNTKRSRGTLESPSHLLSGDNVGRFYFRAWTSGIGYATYSAIKVMATENHYYISDFDKGFGMKMEFYTVPNGGQAATLGVKIDEDGGVYMPLVYNDANTSVGRNLRIQSDGRLVYETSSERYKENIRDITSDDTKGFYDIEPRIYDRIDESRTNEIGIIAEDLVKIFPQLTTNKTIIHYKKECEVLTEMVNGKLVNDTLCVNVIDYTEITDELETVELSRNEYLTILTSVIQEQKQDIDDLTARIKALEGGLTPN